MYTFDVLRPYFEMITVEIERTEPKPYEALVQKIKEAFDDTLDFQFRLEFLKHPDQICHPKNHWVKIENERDLKVNLAMTRLCDVKKIKIDGEPDDLITSAIDKGNIHFVGAQPLGKEVAFLKMSKNAERAIAENIIDQKLQDPMIPFPLDPRVLSPAEEETEYTPEIFVDIAEDIGTRETMEDAHFALPIEQGFLAGVFDGHNGHRTSLAVAAHFPRVFELQMHKSDNNVRYAFEATMEVLHDAFFDIFDDGSTGVVSFVDPKLRMVYTATLGDSEAFLCRNFGEETSLIPLSCVRDYTSKNDYERAAKAIEGAVDRFQFKMKMSTLKRTYMATDYWTMKNAARFHYGEDGFGPNLSRSFGDKPFFTFEDKDVMSIKPKITVRTVEEGDWILMACDGLWDYLSKQEVKNIIENASTSDKDCTAPKDLIKAAKAKFEELGKGYGDNISIVLLRME